MHEGGANCLKYLKRRCNRKEGRGNKDIKKKGGQDGSKSGCVKKGGLEPPYELWLLSLQNEVGLSPFKKFVLFVSMKIVLKTMKSAFYFILKALLTLKIFKFLS